MEAYLQAHFEFRYNLVSEETEYREISVQENVFYPVTQRELNSFCIEARKNGIECWDRDISRYINSRNIEEFHPFRLYIQELPEWDGTDRLRKLAGRVSENTLWVSGFHRWMLAMVAQWMEMDSLHANSVAPVLISRKQGKQKSTFCKMLLPAALQRYYTDSVDLNSFAQTEQKLTMFGLINLDEFDKIPVQKMALLKNLMQMAGLSIRKAHKKCFRPLPRMASFIATSNQRDLLTDPSGSRRFLCVEIEDKIDCSPIDHDQIYAQLKAELLAGERYWFTGQEEAEIMSANASFYKHAMEEELFHTCFRTAEAGEESLSISAADIFQRLKKYNPSAMRGVS
ncbi:MAG: VapE family protein, partial [Tannerellaceae bacterium]